MSTPTRFACPNCQRRFPVHGLPGGSTVTCPGCSAVLVVPAIGPPPLAGARPGPAGAASQTPQREPGYYFCVFWMAILSLTAIVLSVLLGHDYWWKNRSSDDGDEPRTRVARDSGNLRNAVPRGLQFDHTSEVATVKWARQLSREFRKLRTARMRNEIALGDGLSVTESRLRQLSGTNVEWSLPYRGVQGGNVLLGAVQTQRFIVTKRSRTGGNEPSRYLVLPYLLLSRHEMPTGGTLKKGWNRWTVSKTLPLLVGTEITRADAGTLNAGRRVKIKAKVRRVSVGTEGHFVTIELDDISFLGPVDEYPLTDANNILNPILLDVSPERLKTLSPGQVKSQLESSMQKLPSFRIR